jgi:hypothetical protein
MFEKAKRKTNIPPIYTSELQDEKKAEHGSAVV